MTTLNLRTDQNNEAPEPTQPVLTYKTDAEIRVKLKKGDLIRARVKDNLALYKPVQNFGPNDQMKDLKGKSETFKIRETTDFKEGIIAIGFGYVWTLDWLENLEFLANASREI